MKRMLRFIAAAVALTTLVVPAPTYSLTLGLSSVFLDAVASARARINAPLTDHKPTILARLSYENPRQAVRFGSGYEYLPDNQPNTRIHPMTTRLPRFTTRLDELRSRLDAAENVNQIAAIYALEEEIKELETTRMHLLNGLIERVVDEAAA